MEASAARRGDAKLALVDVSAQEQASSRDSDVSNSKRYNVFLGLCLVGFFINCQPSEPFLTRFLIEDKGLTEDQLDNEVWPYNTYGSFFFLLPVGFVAEIYGYRRVVFIGLLCREATRIILLFADGVALMAVMQVTYAAATCANTIYFAYAYMVVAQEDFDLSSSLMRFSYHAGNMLGAIVGQLLVDAGHPLRLLFYLSWGFTTLGLLCFIFLLPAPTRTPPPSLAGLLLSARRGRGNANDDSGGFSSVYKELQLLYKPTRIRNWSIYWAIMFGVHSMVGNYYQNQVYNVDPDTKFGYLEAAMEAAAAVGALAAFKSSTIGPKWTSPMIFGLASATGVCLLLASLVVENLIAIGLFNILPMGMFGFGITLASAQIATDALTPRYAVAFSLNTFVSLGIATIVQQIAAAQKTTTDGYYIIAMVESFLLAIWAAVATFSYSPTRLTGAEAKGKQDDNNNEPPSQVDIEESKGEKQHQNGSLQQDSIAEDEIGGFSPAGNNISQVQASRLGYGSIDNRKPLDRIGDKNEVSRRCRATRSLSRCTSERLKNTCNTVGKSYRVTRRGVRQEARNRMRTAALFTTA